MREILFKAKRIDNGEWIEGYLFDNGFDGEEKKYFIGGLIIEKYNGTACDEWVITGIDFCEIIQRIHLMPDTQRAGMTALMRLQEEWSNHVVSMSRTMQNIRRSTKTSNGDWTREF